MISLEQSSPQIESVWKSLAQNCSNVGYGVEQSTYWIHVAWNYPHEMWNISFTLTDLKRYIKEYELNQENLRILHCYIVICLDLTSVQSIILFYIYIINMNSYANLLFQSFICTNSMHWYYFLFYLFILFVVIP